jgi:osmotically inducible lipoprotein OsmB
MLFFGNHQSGHEAPHGLSWPTIRPLLKGFSMRITLRPLSAAVLLAATLATTGCANMSHRDKNTVIGAGIGGVAGSVLTGGSAIGTVGGAAVGGFIGNQVNTGRRR